MIGDDTVRLTYAELAEARGITIDSARRMTVRHRWPKQIGNDDRAEAKAQEARAVLDEQSAEHRRVVEALVARIPPPRRRWWAWGRRT